MDIQMGVDDENKINPSLQDAIQYISENYHTSITLNELAEKTYVSAYYLSRIFKKQLGKSFVVYLTEVRIQEAKRLLRENTYKTYEVAERVGIQDPQYFSKVFKKYEKMTPKEYKESFKDF